MKRKLRLEKAATRFRKENGYDTFNPIRIKSLLLQLNVLTVYKDMNEKFSGLSLKIDGHRFMLINSKHSIGRQHFTACHELYHLYEQENFEETFCDESNKTEVEEKNADIFAANLLIPEDGLLRQIPDKELQKNKIQINTMLEIEQFYACSHQALLRRIQDLGIITTEYSEKLAYDIKSIAEQYGYEKKLYEPGNSGLVLGNYGAKAKNLYDRNIISESHYLELMRIIGISFEETGDANANHRAN